MVEVPVLVCEHVLRRERPILLVAVEDADRMYLCGTPHALTESFRLVDEAVVFELDPTVQSVSLARGRHATRTAPGAEWREAASSFERFKDGW